MKKTIFCLLSFLLTAAQLLTAVRATPEILEEDPQEIVYQKGIQLRKNKNFKDAAEVFRPLAEGGHVKAAHNLAFCAYELGQEMTAWEWYAHAAREGFKPSENNLKRMNLLFLLPEECLLNIMRFMDIQELCLFQRTCRTAYRLADDESLLQKHLQRLEGGKGPLEGFRMMRALYLKNSNLEIHFRDKAHLIEITCYTPKIKVKGGHPIFVHDPEMSPGAPVFVPQNKKTALKREKIVLVNSTKAIPCFAENIISPYKIHFFSLASPKLRFVGSKLTYSFIDPGTSTKSEELKTKRTKLDTSLRFLRDCDQILKNFGKYSNESINTCTEESTQLLQERFWDRHCNPEAYEGFFEKYPECKKNRKIKDGIPTNHLESTQPILHVGKDYTSLQEFLKLLPTRSPLILVDRTLTTSGVFTRGSITIGKGFRLTLEDEANSKYNESPMFIRLPKKLKEDSYHYTTNHDVKIKYGSSSSAVKDLLNVVKILKILGENLSTE